MATWGGKLPEVNDPSVTKVNPIRPGRAASLRALSEAPSRPKPGESGCRAKEPTRFDGGAVLSRRKCERQIPEQGGQVVGNGRVGRIGELSRDLRWGQPGGLGLRPKVLGPSEVRASIVARKRGNARGAKGRRKVDAWNYEE